MIIQILMLDCGWDFDCDWDYDCDWTLIEMIANLRNKICIGLFLIEKHIIIKCELIELQMSRGENKINNTLETLHITILDL